MSNHKINLEDVGIEYHSSGENIVSKYKHLFNPSLGLTFKNIMDIENYVEKLLCIIEFYERYKSTGIFIEFFKQEQYKEFAISSLVNNDEDSFFGYTLSEIVDKFVDYQEEILHIYFTQNKKLRLYGLVYCFGLNTNENMMIQDYCIKHFQKPEMFEEWFLNEEVQKQNLITKEDCVILNYIDLYFDSRHETWSEKLKNIIVKHMYEITYGNEHMFNSEDDNTILKFFNMYIHEED